MEGMDILEGARDAEGQMPMPPLGEDFVMPSVEQMLEALDKMDLSDEDKETLKETLMSRSQMNDDNLMADLFKPAFEILPSGSPMMQSVLIVVSVIMLTLFVFFGYKLYRSLTEKERKRDEKRKQKQMKKKK